MFSYFEIKYKKHFILNMSVYCFLCAFIIVINGQEEETTTVLTTTVDAEIITTLESEITTSVDIEDTTKTSSIMLQHTVPEVTNISMAFIGCDKWSAQYEFYFHAMNAFLVLTLLCGRSHGGTLIWRLCVCLAGACGLCWARTTCAWDALAWGIALVLGNLIHALYHMYALRPVRFSKEVEDVYRALFLPLKVSRHQFRKVLRCMRAIQQLSPHEVYAHEKVTRVDCLSLVLSGKLVVSQNQRALHIVFAHHFLDSPEWFGVTTDDYFQVSITAMEESRLLIWHRDKLKLTIMSDPFIQAVFDNVLGRDVVHKLMQVSETMAMSYGFLPNSCEDDEDKPMLVIKKSGDGPGITALLNRQMQATDPNTWRLGRIDEVDHETPV